MLLCGNTVDFGVCGYRGGGSESVTDNRGTVKYLLFALGGYGIENSPDRADEIEIDNGAPCYSFGLKSSGGVQELELFEGCTFPTLALAQEEDLYIRPIPLEFCTFDTELLIDSIADLLGLLFRENAHFALGGCLIGGWAKDGLEGIVRRMTVVLRDGLGTNHGGEVKVGDEGIYECSVENARKEIERD
jgi:hypothetical protein